MTGSGRGVGRETAILLAKKGLNIVVCSRTEGEINDTVELIKKIHHGVIGVKCDVRVASQVNSVVKETVAKFGSIEILVNNAGIFTVKKLVDTTENEWDEILSVNLKGTYLFCRAVLPHMIAKESNVIVNVSSGAGKTGFDGLSAYCASKFGMIGLTESLAWEVASGRTRVMTICPGEVATKMQESDPEYYQENKDKMLRPEQVAARIVEMIFDNKYRNGQSVDI